MLELIEGTSSKQAYRTVLRLIGQFEIVETTTEDVVWATEQLALYRHSHHIDTFDALIAATSIRLSLSIYTRNLKHFVILVGQRALSPY